MQNTTLSINPNKHQKYKTILRMDFLIDCSIDFLFSKGEINWQGVGITFSKVREEELESDKQMSSNNYKLMSAEEIEALENQDNLTTKQKQ